MGISPAVVVEPNCGYGSFILSAIRLFHSIRDTFAYDINNDYISLLKKALPDITGIKYHVAQQDFFSYDWDKFFSSVHGEILVLGNPPWVTNAALGSIGSKNLPQKTNLKNHSGFAAKTGKANFDISEWMLIKLLESLGDRHGYLAMLCKTTTARKALKHAWLNHFKIGHITLHLIDAALHFGVSVDACLLVAHTGISEIIPTAEVYSDLSFNKKLYKFGLIGKELVADVDEYNHLKSLDGFPYYKWRSGVKHDAASIMELKKDGLFYINGLSERVELEPAYLFPLLKSSDLANQRLTPQRYVLVTQRTPSEDTYTIKTAAPKTWNYLIAHEDLLDRRKSIIYQKRPKFSVFGIGEYSFSQWKVAISGLYKKLQFVVVGQYHNKPILLDDTCYFIPCSSEQEAYFICSMLNSEIAKRFLHTLIFFDAKRPITIDILNRINMKHLAEKLSVEGNAIRYLSDADVFEKQQGFLVYEEKAKYRTKKSSANRI